MHILLACNFKEYHLGWFAWRALRSMGHRITVLTPIDGPAADTIKCAEDVYVPDVVKNMADKPDLFLYIEVSVRNRYFPRGVLELDIPTAVWLGDNFLNWRWHKEYCAMYDYAFWCQKGRMERAARAWGYTHQHWLPFACDEEIHRDFNMVRDRDVGYVGTVIPAKRRFFEKLAKAGVPVQFNTTFLDFDEIGQFNSRCKIVYNISARFDVNPRSFEACYAGALMIGQRVIDPGFYDIFTPGVNCDVHDFDDAPEIIKKYLADPALRDKVAAAGQKLVREGHTYKHRMETLIRICAGGVTERRGQFARSYRAHLKMALVYQHPHFKMKKEAAREFKAALAQNPLGTLLDMLNYAWWRVREKVEKLIWEMGKRPV